MVAVRVGVKVGVGVGTTTWQTAGAGSTFPTELDARTSMGGGPCDSGPTPTEKSSSPSSKAPSEGTAGIQLPPSSLRSTNWMRLIEMSGRLLRPRGKGTSTEAPFSVKEGGGTRTGALRVG